MSDAELDNEKHEMFARCVAVGNDPYVCRFGVGMSRERTAAELLAKQKIVKNRIQYLKEAHALSG